MKILFDQGTPAPLRRHLDAHEVHTVFGPDAPGLEQTPQSYRSSSATLDSVANHDAEWTLEQYGY
jgi:hypothetical protein